MPLFWGPSTRREGRRVQFFLCGQISRWRLSSHGDWGRGEEGKKGRGEEGEGGRRGGGKTGKKGKRGRRGGGKKGRGEEREGEDGEGKQEVFNNFLNVQYMYMYVHM